MGLAAWAVTAMTGFQDDLRTAQASMEMRLSQIAGDVRVMAATVSRLDGGAKRFVTEERMRDFVRLQMLEAAQPKDK